MYSFWSGLDSVWKARLSACSYSAPAVIGQSVSSDSNALKNASFNSFLNISGHKLHTYSRSLHRERLSGIGSIYFLYTWRTLSDWSHELPIARVTSFFTAAARSRTSSLNE